MARVESPPKVASNRAHEPHVSPTEQLASYGIYLAMVQAWLATMGSLYLSEVMGFIPCALCWWQRIFMYPIALVLTFALLRNDERAPGYALLLAIPGFLFSTYHYLLQKTNLFGDGTNCLVDGGGIPCKTDYLNWFGGVVTIPLLAWISFTIIIISAIASIWVHRRMALVD